jgi:transposase InsO family protein
MDFIIRLPSTQKNFDSIWVIVDCLTKSAHFIPVRTDCRPHEYAALYMTQIVRLHGVLRTIVSDRGPQFTAHFFEHLHKEFGTNLVRSSAYHPQTSGQIERVNQILEDMLRACIISVKGSWDKWLPLAEFSYNNGYQESIKMAPFEALYGQKCRTPLN